MTEIGPILRSLRRHKGPSALLVLEVAMGMVVLVHLLVMGTYYVDVAFAHSGLDEANLIFVTRRFTVPGPAGRAEPASGARAKAASDLALLAKVEGTVGAVVVDELPLPELEAFPTIVRSEDGDGGGAAAWPLRASDNVVAALGVRTMEGAGFSPGDQAGSAPRRALVTERLGRKLFPEGGAVGRWIGGEGLPRARITGVVADFRVRMPFLPDTRSVIILADLPVSEHRLIYIVRSVPGQRERVAAGITAAFQPPTIAGGDTISVTGFLRSEKRPHAIATGATIVVTWMGLVVLGVALFGSLALASFSVAERTRQIGVRRALGARRGQIVRYFLLENAIVTGIGLGLGLTLALVVNYSVRRMSPIMAATWQHIAISMALFWVAGLLSALVPARRAARIPPTAATRSL